MAKEKIEMQEEIRIKPPRFRTIRVKIIGTSPYMQLRFGEGAKQKMKEGMLLGDKKKKNRSTKEARDFDKDYKDAMYLSTEGWHGIPASAFRAGLIDVCRMTDLKMTQARLSIFVEGDGLDALEGIPLVKIEGGKPERTEMIVRNTGMGNPPDIRVRPMWRKWACRIRIRFDEDQHAATDIVNLLARLGFCGVGEGRAFVKRGTGTGLGFGFFKVESVEGD